MKSIWKILLLALTAYSVTFPQIDYQIAPNGIPTSARIDSLGNIHLTWWNDSSNYSIFDNQGQSLLPSLNFADHFSQSASLALSRNQTTFVWRQVSFTFNSYIYGRTFSYLDSTLSASIAFHDSYGDAERFSPKVEYATDTTIIVVWSGMGPQTHVSSGVYAQFASDSLQLHGTNILFSDDTAQTRDNFRPRIAVDRDLGRIGVVWLRGNYWGNTLVARWFDYSGSPLAPSLIVPTDTSRNYYWGHSIAKIPGGGYIVAWSAVSPDSVCNIFTREFDAAGVPEGPESPTNTSPATWYSESEVAVDADSASIVAWEADGEWVRTKAQRFDQNLGPIGSEFFLSPTQDTLNQYLPLIQLFDGKIYTVWKNGSEVRGSILDFLNPPVSASPQSRTLPENFYVRNYPNPFNAGTVIRFALPFDGIASLTAYNLLGNKVDILVHKYTKAGIHSINWQAQHLASGVYLLRLHSGSLSTVQKVLLLK